jgi:hypothetical protein
MEIAWGTNNEKAWEARQTLCRTAMRTDPFYKHHKHTKNSTPQHLQHICNTTPHPTAPTIPERLLHLIYGKQYELTKLTGYRSKRNREGKVEKCWRVQHAPIHILPHHMEAYIHYNIPISHYTPLPNGNIVIQWKDQVLTENQVKERIGEINFLTLLQTFHKQIDTNPTPTTHPPRQDITLSNGLQQGQIHNQGNYSASTKCNMHTLIHIHTEDQHPTWDINPPGTHTIQYGINNHASPELQDSHTAYIYDPKGKCIGHTPTEQLHQLHHQYTISMHNNPSARQLYSAGSFEKDMANMLYRYKDTTPTSTNPLLRDNMLKLGTLLIGDSHPFTQHTDTLYNSQHPEDTLFGAQTLMY